MKTTIFFINLLVLTSISFAQTAFNASISLDHMNVIYTTVDNSISIHTNVSSSDIECTIDKGGILENGHFNNSYSIRVNKEGDYQFKIIQRSTGAAVSYSLRAKRLPTPVANLNSIFGGDITLQQLSSAKELTLSYVPGIDFNITAEITGFTLLKISKANNRSEVNNFTGVFSNETKDLIRSGTPGDIIIFKSIKANGPDPGSLTIPDLILYVK